MSSLVLESLEISGFRVFQHLQIERLGRVNLVVGKNNVGKTCLLEALRLYADRGLLTTIRDLLVARDEIDATSRLGLSTGEFDDTIRVAYVQAVEHLFCGWRAFAEYPATNRFSIGPIEAAEAQLAVSTEWYGEQEEPESNRRIWKPVHQLAYVDGAEGLVSGLSISLGKESLLSSPIDRFLLRLARPTSWPTLVKGIPNVYVPAGGLEEKQIAMLWDTIALRAGEEDVLQGLRIISPDVQRLTLLGASDRSGIRTPVVRIEHLDEPVPLRSLGEGMNRLFGIVLALVNARDGLLLIDEIDSGLHYTVHKDLWDLVFEVAARLKVQVFATTHSWDCVEGFQQSAEKHQESGMLIRLENRQGHIVPILFDRERLGIATRQDIKVL